MKDVEHYEQPQEGMRQCPYCGWFFWPSQKNQIICGDAPCVKARQKEYNANKERIGGKLVYKKKKEKIPEWELPPKRHCVDCGKPTNNYRCRACWARLKDSMGCVESSIAEYSTGGRKTFHE